MRALSSIFTWVYLTAYNKMYNNNSNMGNCLSHSYQSHRPRLRPRLRPRHNYSPNVWLPRNQSSTIAHEEPSIRQKNNRSATVTPSK